MSELSKRIFTSFILLIILFLSIFNNYILFFSIVFCFYQIYFEFYNLLKNIFSIKKKIKLFFSLIILMFILTYLILFIWITLNSSDNFDKIFLLFIITIAISTDIGGYVFGKIFKGKKLTKISPKKTYSGMIGSFVTSLFVVYLIFQNYLYFDYLFLYIMIISFVSQAGDIFISYLKRKNNFKDTDNILPGHGGLLDRFDGIIFAILIGTFLRIFV